jgi:hypothetical protein
MSILLFLILTLLQCLIGFGILTLLGIRLRPGSLFPLAILLGLAVFSLLPFLLQLFYIPLEKRNIWIAVLLSCLVLNVRFSKGLKNLREGHRIRFRIQPYDLVFLFVIVFIVFLSVWRCFYFPPTPRDITSGAEVIAEYAVREKTMINSVFTVNLESTNNPFKPPFVTSLQIIYKCAGFPFGQVWLSAIFIAFIIFLYLSLVQRIHTILAGFLLIIFLAIPEMYAYSFMVLFDYSNAVFFFLSLYFLFEFFKTSKNNCLALGGVLMGIAVYIRSETLVFALFMALLLCWHHIKKWDSLTKMIISNLYFLIPSILFYLLSVTIYLNFYLPVKYDIGGLVNTNLGNIQLLWDRFYEMNTSLIFSEQGVGYYGYFIMFFLVFLIIEVIFTDRWRAEPKTWIYGILVIYFGYPLLSYLLPLVDIDHTVKRGLFKMFPLMLMHMGSSRLLREFSARIWLWERGKTKKLIELEY